MEVRRTEQKNSNYETKIVPVRLEKKVYKKLKKVALEYGLRPSTFARFLLTEYLSKHAEAS